MNELSECDKKVALRLGIERAKILKKLQEAEYRAECYQKLYHERSYENLHENSVIVVVGSSLIIAVAAFAWGFFIGYAANGV